MELVEEHKAFVLGVSVKVGKGFTLTVTVAGPLLQVPLLPVTVYMVVVVGVALGLAQVVQLKAVPVVQV